MLYINIPLNPVGKKNNQQILKGKGGRPFIAQGKRYKDYEKACIQFLPFVEEPICYPVNLKCLFYRNSKRVVDLANLLEAIQDILVVGGVLEDDCRDIVATTDGSEVLYDKAYPRTEIWITRKENYEQWKERSTSS